MYQTIKRLAVIASIFMLPSIVSALTLGDIREQVRYIVKDTTATTNYTRWSDPVINDRINMVQDTICAFTRCSYDTWYATPTALTAEIRKPTNMITIDRVSMLQQSSTTATNQYKKLTWASMPGLDRDFPGWSYQTAGLPRYYYERSDYIGLYPTPSATYISTGCLKVDYYKKSDEMTDDGDIPFDGNYELYAYHDVIISGVVAMMLKDLGDLQGAATYKSEFIDGMKFMKENIVNKPDKVQTIRTN